MKVATFNANSIRVRLPAVLDWLAKQQPDVLCLQETKVQDTEFPVEAFKGTGYYLNYRGMKSYNGVALLSRKQPSMIHYGLRDDHAPARPSIGISYGEADESRMLHAVVDGVHVVNTYVPQGYQIDSPRYAYKLLWFRRLRQYFERHFTLIDPVVWCGDLNVAPREMDVHSPEKHLKHVCFHQDVRQAYAETIKWGFEDVFLRLHPDKQQFTFWDYRKPNPSYKPKTEAARNRPPLVSSFTANRGWRIDHILATPPLAKRCQEVQVDLEPRAQEQASDHTFLWAKFGT